MRLELYKKRKLYLIDKLTAEALTLKNKARFIVEKCDGDIVLGLFFHFFFCDLLFLKFILFYPILFSSTFLFKKI